MPEKPKGYESRTAKREKTAKEARKGTVLEEMKKKKKKKGK